MAFADDVNKFMGKLPPGGVPTAEELFPDSFMRRNTRFASIGDFHAAATAGPARREPNTPEWSAFVAETTQFGSWEEMVRTAATEFSHGAGH